MQGLALLLPEFHRFSADVVDTVIFIYALSPLGIVKRLALDEGYKSFHFYVAHILGKYLYAFYAYFRVGYHDISSLIKSMGFII